MTQEEKELLLKDLSARLRYGLIVSPSDCGNAKLVGCLLDSVLIQDIRTGEDYDKPWDIEYVRSYLRPMSSMTEEEEIEYDAIFAKPWYNSFYIDNSLNGIDWLNAHHFDYRGLIEKGLAVEVTEENNPYKE